MDMKLPPGLAQASQAATAARSIPPFSYAFQPIADVADGTVYGYEALVRGPTAQPATRVFERIAPDSVDRFDHESRIAAIGLASRLRIATRLSVNLLPRSLLRSANPLEATIAAARRTGFPVDRLIVELPERDMVDDYHHIGTLLAQARRLGVKVAVDDFGTGHSGLNLLAGLLPDLIKLDIRLVRGIEHDRSRQAIVRALVHACRDLGIDLLAEGVETVAEYRWLVENGLTLLQGYLLARPGFECLPSVDPLG